MQKMDLIILIRKSSFHSTHQSSLLEMHNICTRPPEMAVPLKFDFPVIWMRFFSFQVGLAIAIRYALSRRAFSMTPNGPEVLLLDYPSHQRRLLPLLAKS